MKSDSTDILIWHPTSITVCDIQIIYNIMYNS